MYYISGEDKMGQKKQSKKADIEQRAKIIKVSKWKLFLMIWSWKSTWIKLMRLLSIW